MNIYLGGEITHKAEKALENVAWDVRTKLDPFRKADPLDETYGSEFHDIGIITMLLCDEFKDIYQERRLVRHKKKDADIRLKIDYDKFVKADEHTQMLLYVKNIVDSIMVVEEKKKGDFKGIKLIEDILLTLGLKKEEIDKL